METTNSTTEARKAGILAFIGLAAKIISAAMSGQNIKNAVNIIYFITVLAARIRMIPITIIKI